jgi:hypothetical protein
LEELNPYRFIAGCLEGVVSGVSAGLCKILDMNFLELRQCEVRSI